MFKAIGDWFKEQLQQPQDEAAEHTVELATAVLFHEMMRADDHLDTSEQAALEAALAEQFALSDEEVSMLLSSSRQRAGEAADFVQFTRVINSACDSVQKRQIMLGLWRIAFADGELAPYEEHLIRRIADLMHIPHSQFIQTKLAVTGH